MASMTSGATCVVALLSKYTGGRRLIFQQLTQGNSRQQMTKHPVPQLGFEPGALGWHNPARIRNGHEVLYGRRKHRKCAGIFPTVDQTLQFRCPADSTHEINPGAGARIGYAENRLQHVLLQ